MWAILLAVACGGKKEAAPTPAPASGSVATAADASVGIDAGAAHVELLHQYLAKVEVSSHVMNKTIKPEHLVDRDFNTAWNSRTGKLAGTWLDVLVFGTAIDEVRLTVGHTGKGPKGEDYFVMNPRITKLSVLDGDAVITTATLDPENRALQAIKLPRRARGTVRLRVDEVVMGTKKSWKEVCISELEAWGAPPADAKPTARVPIVSVYEPPVDTSGEELVTGKPLDWTAVCDKIMSRLQPEYDARDHGMEDAPPRCGAVEQAKIGEAPWDNLLLWQLAYNEAHGPMTCNLLVETTHGTFAIGAERACGPWDGEGIDVRSARAVDALPGGPPELVVEYATTRTGDPPVEMIVCRIANDIVQCTAPIEIEGATWKVNARFTKGTVVFDPIDGKPPATVSGPHALVF